jgi:transcriptional regulator with GAF, ATPase, and Fis domain
MALAEITSFVAGVKGTIDIAKGLKSAYDAQTIAQAQTEIVEKLLGLQMDALSLQEKHSLLINEKDELAKKLIQYENWAKTESQYKIDEVHSQVFVYVAKTSDQSLKNQPWYCANCFGNRQLSIFQSTSDSDTYHEYVCHRCNNKIKFYTEGGPQSEFIQPDSPFSSY